MNTTASFFWLLFHFLIPPSAEKTTEPVATPVVKPLAKPASIPCNCTITQSGITAGLPTMSGFTSAVNFYSYGVPDMASANTGLEISQTMLVMLYEDMTTGNVSLIVILDEAHDGDGGEVSLTYNCMPNSAFVELSDDVGELSGFPPTIMSNHAWGAPYTDGDVIGGIGCVNTFTINPNVISGIDIISAVHGTPGSPTYMILPNNSAPITIDCGGGLCCASVFEFSVTTQNANCVNSADGALDLTTNATSPTFQWSNSATTEDITGLAPGVYAVTVTDADGCSLTANYTVYANNPVPMPDISGPTEFCAGESIELTVMGDHASNQYQWSNGGSGASITVNTTGTYIVTITSSAGCTGTGTITVTENPLPEPEITGPGTICLNYQTITLDAGAGYSDYSWSNGYDTQTTEITEFGSYAVVVTNGFGCTASDNVIINSLANPVPTITGPTAICSGTHIVLDAGLGFESYVWSTGAMTEVIVTTTGGNYSVTVTNADGCEGTASVEITESSADTTLLYLSSCNPDDTGIFIQNFFNQNGCDSIVFTNVSLNESDSVFLFSQSCNPQDTGIFIQTFVNQNGCDSLVITNVSLNEPDSVFQFSQSCNPQDTGVFIQTFVNQNGCDSVVTELVTLLAGQNVSVVDYSCSPQDTGVTVQTFSNQFGCDSVVTTTILLLVSDTTHLSAQSCDPDDAGVTQALFVNSAGCDSLVFTTTIFMLVDTTHLLEYTCDISEAGQSEVLLTNQDGCDSLVITSTTFIPPDTTFLTAITCDANQVGQSVVTLTNLAGCDSLVITNTTFIPPDTTFLSSTTCNPSAAGVFEVVLNNSFGCDSIVISTVTLTPSDTTALFQTSCNPNQAGTAEVVLTNQYGCDSLLIITTAYALADSTHISHTSCNPAEVGVSVVILASTDGCDSVVTTTTTLLPSDPTFVTLEGCDPANVGVVETLLSNQFGCDSLVITTTVLLPSDTIFLPAITCDIAQAGISEATLSNQYGCDSLIITNTTFIPPDTSLLFAQSCDPSQVGNTVIHLQNTSGCDSLVITTTTLLPSDTTVLQASTCDPSQVGVTQVLLTNSAGCDSLIITHTAQLPIDTTWLFFTSCLPVDTGLVILQFSNQSGCDSLVIEQTSLLPSSACQLNAVMGGDTIGCQETTGSLSLTFFNGAPPYAYTWTNQNGNTGSGTFNQTGIPQQVDGLLPGAYTFEIADLNGLMSVLSAVIFQPAPLQMELQVSSDFNGYDISCFGISDGTAAVAGLGGGLQPYSFNWSNGNQTSQTGELSEGWASVTVTDATSCVAVDSVFLESPDSLQFSLSLSNPGCFTDGFGAIAIGQVAGGISPYHFRINGNGWQTSPLFESLPSGSYLIEVEDANGCIASAFAFINSFIQPAVSLGPDMSLEYGDSVTLKAVINLPFSLLDSIYWEGLDCPDCKNVTVTPIVSSTYSVTVVDTLGCFATDELTVAVKKNFHVYIPNAFSPNSDGFNDKFTIYGGAQIVGIKELRIFDRWGESVFTGFNMPPNSLTYGWDGTYRGKLMDNAVFVYYTVVEFVDGSMQLFKGDVILMR